MKEKLLLLGSGGFGRVVLEHAIKEYDCAFLDDRKIDSVDGVPVIGTLDELGKFFPEYRKLIVSIGNNQLRQSLYKKAAAIGYSFPNIIVPSAYISPHAKLGEGCVILNNAVVQNGARVGSGTILNAGVELHHDCIIGNCCLIYSNSVVRFNARVGDRVKIGSTVSVSNSAVVPADSIIDDGCVVK